MMACHQSENVCMDNPRIQRAYVMKTPGIHKLLAVLLCWLIPVVAQAWWHDDWQFRKELVVQTTLASDSGNADLGDVQVLVRLHVGNFSYFLDIQKNGEDIRFVDGDDKTPLKFHIERFDPINQMAMIWVRVPALQAGAGPRAIWMYYGNPSAVSGGDAPGTYDTPQALVLNFSDPQAIGQDATAYQNHAQVGNVSVTEGIIGAAASFVGNGEMIVPPGRGLQSTAGTGFTLSAWMKIDVNQVEATVIDWSGDAGNVMLQVMDDIPRVQLTDAAGAVHEVDADTRLALGEWTHLALVGVENGLTLYVDGKEQAFLLAELPTLNGVLSIGSRADGGAGLTGNLDEVTLANIARGAEWLAFTFMAQSADSLLLSYGEDGQQESAGSHSSFGTILRNVTVDGWVVIVILSIMGVISWIVMISKGVIITRIRRDNAMFLQQFSKLGTSQVDRLDADATEDDLANSPLLTALSGAHKHFESSNIFRIYHSGVEEMHHRTPKAVGAQALALALTPQAIGAIRATMDGSLVRELQKINSQMVLLTIAISGGPFLGLLGTVVGVMIVFAEIAAVGDVNVNAIAPGIAAALVATAAGVGVAIPALFGYNYLGSRIKEISADMHVFVDEFVAKIAEQHS
jgi:biopolymer transport protein ExbB